MNRTHKHIINKVFVDVNTGSKKTAFALKDNIDGFLKDEIFPYMESYFKTLEKELPTEVIKISKLKLEVTANSKNNFETLRESLKKQIKHEINKIVTNPDNEESNAVFLSAIKSKQETIVFFLENGVMPWWQTKKESLEFNEKAIVKLFKSNSFRVLFIKKIEKYNVKNRFINQFSNTQIITILSEVFKNKITSLIELDKVINRLINQLNPIHRQWFWERIIQYCIDKNEANLVSKLVMVLEAMPKKENNTITELVRQMLNVIDKTILNKIKTKDALRIKNSKTKELERKQTSNAFKGVLGNFNSIEKEESLNEDKIENSQEKPNGITEKLTENNVEEHQYYVSGKKQKRNSLGKEEANKEAFKREEKIDSNKSCNVKNIQEEKIKKESVQKNKSEVQNTAKEINNTLENNIEKEDVTNKLYKEVNALKNNGKKEINEGGETINKTGFGKQERENKTLSIKEKNKEEKLLNKESVLKNKILKTSKVENTKDSRKLSKIKQEELFGLINKESTKSLFSKENKGEYYVKNAGLIILHPYLKNFFTACELLSEANEIKDPELAVHLLHYMATKREGQYESNMVFEKFLCGIAIKQSIRREVVIPEDLKQKAEDLLKAVVEHWKALNNASTDLLRNEFLQRSGKLSFKNKNPKVIVERKVFDLLLDKLPWTLSLSKLPWIDKLIYTDW